MQEINKGDQLQNPNRTSLIILGCGYSREKRMIKRS
jgi:hypothetical protein